MEDVRVRSRCLLGWAALLAATAWCGASRADTPDFSGIWWATEYHPKIQLVGGGELPLTAEGKAAYEKNIAGLKDGSVTDAARKFCVPDGLPRVLANPYPFEIVQARPGRSRSSTSSTTRSARSPWTSRMPGEQDLTPSRLITAIRSAISRAIRWWWRPPASTKRRSSTPPARRIPTNCAPRSASARSARRARGRDHHPRSRNTIRAIGRRGSSTSCATTSGSRTMSAASRTAISPRWRASAGRDGAAGAGAGRGGPSWRTLAGREGGGCAGVPRTSNTYDVG